MNTIQLSFTSVESDNFFLSLANVLQAESSHGTIQVPSFNGSGSITRKVISDDIVLICWDMRLTRDMVFSKKAFQVNKDEQSFIISYLLTTEGIIVLNGPGPRTRLKGNRNILFMSGDAELQFEIPVGENFKVVNICVPLRWLKTELNDAQPCFLDFINRLGEKDHPTVFMETSPPAEYRLLSEMNEHIISEDRGNLGLKAKVFSLVADFFSRIFDHSAKEILESKVVHHGKMLEVEHFLKQHLETTLPDIATIARQMMLSVSTLKRHFKMMFGKSIYEYYLEMKMEHARQLLMERNLSVNEVANMLEYEKVSCFIDIFKKHHGHSPGAIKKLA
jgi:AraC-like DNA-binding protein